MYFLYMQIEIKRLILVNMHNSHFYFSDLLSDGRILLSFFQKLPVEVEESAMVDGASEWQMFTKIVLPQVLPGLTAVGILSFMTSWNEYLYGVIFVQDPQNFTIPLLLSTMNSEQELTQWGMVASGGVISLIPVLFFVIFAQNFLISGLSSGAVKE